VSLHFKNDADMENFARKLVDGAQTNTEFMGIIRFGRESLVKEPALLLVIAQLWSVKKDWPIWSLMTEVMDKCDIKLVAVNDKADSIKVCPRCKQPMQRTGDYHCKPCGVTIGFRAGGAA
jgi:hypothetical protein